METQVAPQIEMIEVMIYHLETVFSSVTCPEYVSKAFKEFIAAMKQWAAKEK